MNEDNIKDNLQSLPSPLISIFWKSTRTIFTSSKMPSIQVKILESTSYIVYRQQYSIPEAIAPRIGPTRGLTRKWKKLERLLDFETTRSSEPSRSWLNRDISSFFLYLTSVCRLKIREEKKLISNRARIDDSHFRRKTRRINREYREKERGRRRD